MQLKIKHWVFLFSLLLNIIGCNQQQEENEPNLITPKAAKTIGHLVSKDSMAIPEKIPVDESKLKKVLAGKPFTTHINTNIQFAGIPKVVDAGIPKIIIPGTDTFSLPKKTPAIHRQFSANASESFIVKPITFKNSFNTFGKQHGLKHGIVTSLLQDRSGNLWFCTAGGVSKYDGQSFTQFTEKEGLCNNDVRSILQDKSGNIWFGTRGSGVSKYDGQSFTNFSVNEGLSNNFVFSILEDRSGNIWLGTWGGGVSKYDGKSFTQYTRKEGLVSNYVSSILEDKSGKIWFGTDGGVSRYDGKSFSNFSQNEGLGNNDVHCILEDRAGNIWFGTSGGISKFDNHTFTSITEKEGLINNNVFSILEDKGGNIWLGTFNGISKYDGRTFTQFTEKEGLGNNDIYAILGDRSGNLWFGTAGGGVSKYNTAIFTHFTEKEGLIKNYVFCTAEDKYGNLWFGTWGGGVSKYDGQIFTNLTEKEGLSNNSVRSIYADRRGNIWFATVKGISKYDGRFFTYFTGQDGLINNDVTSILEDKTGTLWFGTTGGVSKYDGRSFTNYTTKQGLSNNEVLCIIEDRSGSIWFGTSYGASKFDGRAFTHFSEQDGLNNNTVNSMHEDRLGNMWFGTSGGVSKYDGRAMTGFTEKNGLINNFVASILEDKYGIIWFGTRYGLSKLTYKKLSFFSTDPKVKNKHEVDIFFKNYDYNDGFLGVGCNNSAILESQKGTIWIGTNFGITAFNSRDISEDSIPPNIQITAVKLFNENIPWQKINLKKDSSFLLSNGIEVSDLHFKGLSNWYNLPQHLSLSYKNNYIIFDFIGINISQSQNVKYQYKLEGIDDNLNSITTQTSASYGSLPAGNYTFRVKAMNSDGYWSNEFKYSFTIRPPWWKTWWFRIMIVVALVGFVFFFGRFIYIYKLRKQRVAMEKQLAVQYERQRISSDLHDEIGSTLSSINIYAGLAKKESDNYSHLDSITQNINDVVNKLDDLVWSINPKYDALGSIETRLYAYAAPAAKAKDISFKIENNLLQAQIKLPAQIKHNIYLIAKELINNAIKHSGCKHIQVSLSQQKNNFIFSVCDDGCGFIKTTVRDDRNGLNNIVLRVSAMHGRITTETGMENGTQTTISIPV